MQRNTLSNLKPALSTSVKAALTVPKRVDEFLTSKPWRELVARLICERGRRCESKKPGTKMWEGCGKELDERGVPIRIFGDHIKERQDGGAHLDPDNVQLLCGSCHSAKTAYARAKRLGR